MAQQSGDWSQGLAAVDAALAVRDAELGDADRILIEVVADAHRVATDSIRRIEAVQAEVDGIGDAPQAARRLLDRHRDLIDTVRSARDDASAKAVALQRLEQQYAG